jgi:hypothetical protein
MTMLITQRKKERKRYILCPMMLRLPSCMARRTRSSRTSRSCPIAVSANMRRRNSFLATVSISFLSLCVTLTYRGLVDCSQDVWTRDEAERSLSLRDGPARGGAGGSGVDGNAARRLRGWSCAVLIAYSIMTLLAIGMSQRTFTIQ